MAESEKNVAVVEAVPVPRRNEADCCVYADVRENELLTRWPGVLEILLHDHTTGHEIFWATDDYAHLGEGFGYSDPIKVESITGQNGNVIVPCALKPRQLQQHRSRTMAEVFTPTWICNKQNNLVDNAWFGREGMFNTEIDLPDGSHDWAINSNQIVFPEGKTWLDYVRENRLEITCGEAPYLVSRYNAVTGETIPIERRIGLLDRKLRVAGENTVKSGEWLKAVQAAYMSTYGFEWQGDSLLLAREALLQTFIDCYRAKFGRDPQLKSVKYIAYIISWNIWQMDGLKGVIPESCTTTRTVTQTLFDTAETVIPCPGCKTGDIRSHNGVYALIKDWRAPKSKQKIRFIDLIK